MGRIWRQRNVSTGTALRLGFPRKCLPGWRRRSVCLVGAGVGLLLFQPWWSTLALGGALLSLVVILSWWNTVPVGARIGAAFDFLVLAALFHPLANGLR